MSINVTVTQTRTIKVTLKTYLATVAITSAAIIAALGFTPENVGNKATNTSLGSSNSAYPSQLAVKTYVDTNLALKQDSLGYTAENIANKDTSVSLGISDTKYPSQLAVKAYVDTGLATKQNSLGFTPENAANKNQASGYAGLDSSGLVPSSLLPSYVDDVLEYANLAAFPATGSTGIIYVAIDTGLIYRWSGSAYVNISASPGSTDAVPEGSLNLYYTTARVDTEFDIRLATKSTSNLTEGSNLYYTTTRARAAISGSAPVSYDNSTGIISMAAATTSVNGYLTSADWTTFNNKQASLTFSSGLTNTANTVANDLITGKAGGQTIIGGTASSEDLILTSTSNATKGTIRLAQVGADATSFATQRSSEILNYRTSQWTGSAEAKGNFTVQSIPSASANTTTLTVAYGGTTLQSLTNGGTFTNTGTLIAQFSDSTTTPISGQFRARNSNTTVGNFAAISFHNGNSAQFNVAMVGARITSHAATGSGQLVFATANLASVNNKMCIDETGKTLIGNNIGTNTAGAQLEVQGQASSITSIFKGNATTPGNLTEWQSSASAILASVSSAGLGSFAGVTLTDATNIIVGSTTGTKIATATSQKIGFWNATPIIQPASANQAAMTNSTTGSYDGTLVDVGIVFSQTAINNNFTDLFTVVNEIRNVLVNTGLMKGAA
jgi:hypothetical protein